MSASFPTQRRLKVLQSVRCLGCGDVYAKPVGGGTAATNPGCPDCGYVGWLPVSAEEPWRPLHFAADRPQHRSA